MKLYLRFFLALLLLATLGLVAVQGQTARKPDPAAPQGGASAAASSSNADLQAIRELLEQFVKSYNARDAKALGDLFTASAEIEDEEGEVTRGREAIVERFTSIFNQKAGGTLEVKPDSIRFLSPRLALETGTATIRGADRNASETSPYSVLYVQEERRWLHARIKDQAPAEMTPHEHLTELAWMIGDWVNESDDSLVSTTCRWSDDGSFLERKFDVKIEGSIALKGTQRIGWDPTHKQFRVWVFDTHGGFGEGLMSRDGERWLVKASGVRSDGQVASATNIITQLGKDRMSWQTTDRTIGGLAVPGVDAFVIVRKPPEPGKAAR